jgi:hypothetical protein
LYAAPGDPLLLWVAQGASILSARLGNHLHVLSTPADTDLFTVLPKSRVLSHALLIPRDVQAFMERTRVVQVIRGPRKLKILLFYGRTRDLSWNPGRLQWSNGKPLMDYSTKIRREFFEHVNQSPIFFNFAGAIPCQLDLHSDGKLTRRLTEQVKNRASSGRFGTVQWQLTNGGLKFLLR